MVLVLVVVVVVRRVVAGRQWRRAATDNRTVHCDMMLLQSQASLDRSTAAAAACFQRRPASFHSCLLHSGIIHRKINKQTGYGKDRKLGTCDERINKKPSCRSESRPYWL